MPRHFCRLFTPLIAAAFAAFQLLIRHAATLAAMPHDDYARDDAADTITIHY